MKGIPGSGLCALWDGFPGRKSPDFSEIFGLPTTHENRSRIVAFACPLDVVDRRIFRFVAGGDKLPIFWPPTVGEMRELLDRPPTPPTLVVIYLGEHYDLELLRQLALDQMKRGVHVLFLGQLNRAHLRSLPLSFPIITEDHCSGRDDELPCRRPARTLEKTEVFLPLEFLSDFLSFWQSILKLNYPRPALSLEKLKQKLQNSNRTKRFIASAEKWFGYSLVVTRVRSLCFRHHRRHQRRAKLTVLFGSAGALSYATTGRGKSETLAVRARQSGTVVFSGFPRRRSRAGIRGVSFVYTPTFAVISANERKVTCVDEFHLVKGDWRAWLLAELEVREEVVVALPFSYADGQTLTMAAELFLLADEVHVHTAECWKCGQPAHYLACFYREGNGQPPTRHELDQLFTRAGLRLSRKFNWEACCARDHPLLSTEVAEEKDESGLTALMLRRKFEMEEEERRRRERQRRQAPRRILFLAVAIFIGLDIFLYPEEFGQWLKRLLVRYLTIAPLLSEVSRAVVASFLNFTSRINLTLGSSPFAGLVLPTAFFSFLALSESMVFLYWRGVRRRSQTKCAGIGVFVPPLTLVALSLLPYPFGLLVTGLIFLTCLATFIVVKNQENEENWLRL